MLRVFAYLQGRPEPVEITVRPSGQNLVAPSPGGGGRRAHFWWGMEELEASDPQAAEALRMLAPNLDRLWVGRDVVPGQQPQRIFDGAVVECGYDQQMVSVTGMEPLPRPAQSPPQAPGGGVREPVGPPPGGMPPVAQQQPPRSPAPQGEENLAEFASPGAGPQPVGGLLTQGLFVRSREAVPAGQTG